ncbi:hypothetical protein E4U21_005615 [Claviceps maximensis]|nr:hypothetical protein E4U21_005615 [Claviceps maximensis]
MASIPDDLAGHHDLKSAQRKACYCRVFKPQHRTLSRLVRANAKHLVETGQTNIFPLCSEDHAQLDHACLRTHIQRDLRNHYTHARKPLCRDRTPRKIDTQGQEGRDLAYSDIPLPSDRYRLVRRPTLEREDAFCDASTSMPRVSVRRQTTELGNAAAAAAADDDSQDDDRQVAHLYRMGLLYDDTEQDHGTGSFDLNSIRHDVPLYSIRPAKRERKCNRARRSLDTPLNLDLSFSDLGEDEALAQYLMAMTRAEAAAGDDDTNKQQLARHDAAKSDSQPESHAESQPPLRVIYELASSPSTTPPDLDTSVPPDLVADLLSDYDCFSEGELDDTPLQTELHEDAETTPTDVWVMLGDGS